jgi:Ser/Thr protein kinase RdoA (MazF antagonist)
MKLSFIKGWQHNNQQTNDSKKQAILNYTDFFLATGQAIKKNITSIPYFPIWKEQPLHEHYLCHGDFHTGNILISDSSFYMIDWEFVRYDFPSIDIARVLFLIMHRHKEWNVSRFQLLLSAYFKENPLTAEQMEMLFLDLAFPHAFERFVRKKEYKEMSLEEVEQFLESEHDKTNYMLG